MFAAVRTPQKDTSPVKKGEKSPVSERQKTEKAGSSTVHPAPAQVRRSVGEIEAKIRLPGSASPKTKPPPRQGAVKYMSRITEAKAQVVKAKTAMNLSKNLKTEIKKDITEAVDRLFSLIKEAEGVSAPKPSTDTDPQPKPEEKEEKRGLEFESQLLKRMEEQEKLLRENKEEIIKIGIMIKENEKPVSYAGVAAGPAKRPTREEVAMHSIAITSKAELETGDQVLDRVRKAVNAREEGVKVDRIRKARDHKIILGCQSKQEIEKVKDRLKKSGGDLQVEEIANKNPLIILKYVMDYLTDDEVLGALVKQNKNLFKDIPERNMATIKVKYRRRTRNKHVSHMVLTVPPDVWRRLTDAGIAHIDLQRIKVEDHSPLIQCTRCLGYGHSKRFCKDTADMCSHCGGPHLRTECEDWIANIPAKCRNCTRARVDQNEHNAFSPDCPMRRKWDELARSSIAYC